MKFVSKLLISMLILSSSMAVCDPIEKPQQIIKNLIYQVELLEETVNSLEGQIDNIIVILNIITYRED